MVARSNVNDLTDTTIAPASSAMATNAGMPTSDGAPAAIEFDLSQSPPSDSRKRFEAEAAKRRAMKRTLTPARTRSMSAGRKNVHGISFDKPRMPRPESVRTRGRAADGPGQTPKQGKLIDGEGWTIVKIVEQLDMDRQSIVELRDTVDTMYRSQQQQMVDVTTLQKLIDANDVKNGNIVTGLMQNEEMQKMKHFIEKHEAQDNKMAAYLEQLAADRPLEGYTIAETFKTLYKSVEELKHQTAKNEVYVKEVSAAQAAVGAATPARLGAKEAEMCNKMMQDIAALRQEMDVVKDKKCHCDHVDQNLERLVAAEQQIILVMQAVERAAPPRAGPFTAHMCGAGAQYPGSSPAWTPPGCGDGVQGAMGVPADEPAGETPVCFSVSNGGNGKCHCTHVEDLLRRMAAAERSSRVPLIPAQRVPNGAAPRVGAGAQEEAFDPSKPLDKRPLGLLNNEKMDRPIYDDKMATQPEYRFDGQKGGVAWKSKTERYLISKCPALMSILKWAEKHDKMRIEDDAFDKVVGHFMMEEQQRTINAAIWGLLSICLTGSADTMFKQADMLNGLDAWRRVVRIIDNGLPLRLEELRGEVRLLHTKPIKDLESVATGIAEFEEKIREYREAGGTGFVTDNEMKSDLVAILPARLREDLLWQATDPSQDFMAFRDHVTTTAARILSNRRRGGVNAVESPAACNPEDEDENDGPIVVNSMDDLIGAFNRFQNRGGRRNEAGRTRGQTGRQPTPPAPNGPARKRLCPNCCQEHEGRCSHPRVEFSERRCFTCGEKHMARNCPQKKAGGKHNNGIRAIEDGPAPFFVIEEDDGFRLQRTRGKRNAGPSAINRPMPRGATLGDFVPTKIKNSFGTLGCTTEDNKPTEKLPKPNEPNATKCKMKLHGDMATDGHNFPKLMSAADQELQRVNEILVQEETRVGAIYEEEDDDFMGAAEESRTVSCAIDSGAVDNVINPDELPAGVKPSGNPTGKRFTGANGSGIRRYGHANTLMKGECGDVGCRWEVADVTRALNSVSKVAGPKGGPGKQDVLFNNNFCYVVPPGIVEKVMKTMKPVAKYHREGGLYLADMTISSFVGQEQSK